MNWDLVSLAKVAPSPWRNGGGSTRELLAWPSAADWQVRLSVADVESDGPFSAFPGIERWFAVLEGEGVDLRLGDALHALTPNSEPFRFDGGAPVACTLIAGPTRDLNLMAPPGRSAMVRVRGTHRTEVAAGTLVALYTHHAGAHIATHAQWLGVPAGTLAWCRAGAAMQLQVDAEAAWWMEVKA